MLAMVKLRDVICREVYTDYQAPETNKSNKHWKNDLTDYQACTIRNNTPVLLLYQVTIII